MAVLGFLQFVSPTLQFAIAVAVFGEPMGGWTLVSFAILWAGLALFVVDSLRSASRRSPRGPSWRQPTRRQLILFDFRRMSRRLLHPTRDSQVTPVSRVATANSTPIEFCALLNSPGSPERRFALPSEPDVRTKLTQLQNRFVNDADTAPKSPSPRAVRRTGMGEVRTFSAFHLNSSRKERLMHLSGWFTSRTSRTPIRNSRRRPQLEQLEARCTPTVSGYRPIDEVGNNVANPGQGTAGTDLLRVSPAAYADGIDSPVAGHNQSARVISDLLNNQADPDNPTQDLDDRRRNSLSDFGYAFGQFMDHDMDLTPTGSDERCTIAADPNDPSQHGRPDVRALRHRPGHRHQHRATRRSRSTPSRRTSICRRSTARPPAIADALRTHSGGLLKTSPGNMLPYDNSTYFTPAQLALFNMANDSGAVADPEPVRHRRRARQRERRADGPADAVRPQSQPHRRRAAASSIRPGPTSSSTRRPASSTSRSIRKSSTTITCPTCSARTRMPKYTGYKPNVDPADRHRVLDRRLPVRPQPARAATSSGRATTARTSTQRSGRRRHQPGDRLLRPERPQPGRRRRSAHRPHLHRHRRHPQGRRRRRLAGRRPAGDRRHPQSPLRQRRPAPTTART